MTTAYLEPEPSVCVLKNRRMHWAACGGCGSRVHYSEFIGPGLPEPAQARCISCGQPWDGRTVEERPGP